MMSATEKKFRKQQQFFFDMLPEGMTDFGLDPSWVRIYPYQILAAPGETKQVQIRVQNYKPSPMKMEVALVAPPEWRIEPDVLKFEVPANSKASHAVSRDAAQGLDARATPRFAIAADVMSDGKYLGQITEATVDIMGPGARTT